MFRAFFKHLMIYASAAVFLAVAGHTPTRSAGPLRIVAEHYPPYEMKMPVDGLQGFDYEVAIEVFQRLDIPVEIVFLPWKRALVETENGETLGILTCAHRPERESFILFSDPISSFTSGFYYRQGFDSAPIRDVDDITGRRVASVSGYESFKELQKLGANPTEVQTTTQAIKMLMTGRFDYFYAGKETTDFQIRQLGHTGSFHFVPVDKRPFHFCFSKAYPGGREIAEKFNRALSDVKTDGTYDAIHEKYR
ncbi:amino acid ABC transporter substrate-binding protein (PAAT family) [Roseibium hamelinense]|uniref:Amino acid ABC transporter substrate-binding protein (PAAT family) n=1 Tax=Roseibium hamelinense TaxID=150831 RepID=A0A562T7Q1_9HYPH|nr:transporter substrate-binding domain-containing protein [Roseibium hamelinense]MTI42369.1 transporter substrate-binding domain-containing protein [Roseibium hamelinense]TWI89542.1 amino acid ABC transporter substrate-binding protein (PAAT family) [Roseibium hamelinense]